MPQVIRSKQPLKNSIELNKADQMVIALKTMLLTSQKHQIEQIPTIY